MMEKIFGRRYVFSLECKNEGVMDDDSDKKDEGEEDWLRQGRCSETGSLLLVIFQRVLSRCIHVYSQSYHQHMWNNIYNVTFSYRKFGCDYLLSVQLLCTINDITITFTITIIIGQRNFPKAHATLVLLRFHILHHSIMPTAQLGIHSQAPIFCSTALLWCL